MSRNRKTKHDDLFGLSPDAKESRDRDTALMLVPFVKDILFPKLVFVFDPIQLELAQWPFNDFLTHATKEHKQTFFKDMSDEVWKNYVSCLWSNNRKLILETISKKRGKISNDIRSAFYGKLKHCHL